MRARAVGVWLVLGVIASTAAGGLQTASAVDPPDASPATDFEVEEDALLLEEDLLFDEEQELVESSGRDPFEELNRDIFSFNRRMDRWVFDPITRGYQFAVPAPGRRAVYRMFDNLDSPVVLANHMLQFRVVEAAGTVTRFVINSTVGIAGLFDPAASALEVYRVEADFGQTLARYGSPSGPYLMLPIFGPSTLRDVFGDVVDIMADPTSYLLGPFQWWSLALGGGEGLIVREARLADLEALEAGSVDFYSALRSAYLQSRDAMVREARSASAPAGPVMVSSHYPRTREAAPQAREARPAN